MRLIIGVAGVLFNFNAFANTCIQVKENKPYFDRALKAYPSRSKEKCIKLPHLEKNLNPLTLRANKKNQTAFLAVKNQTNFNKLNEVHYIDTKEGKIIKKFTFKGHLNRSFQNLSDTFVPFDNDSKLVFSKDGSLCVFDLKESTLIFNQNYKAPLQHCIKSNVSSNVSKQEGHFEDLRSLTLSKNKAKPLYLWSLVKSNNKKHIYGFKINEEKKINKIALYKFELPKNLRKAVRISPIEEDSGKYAFGVSTSLKNPGKNLYKIVYKKLKNSNDYKVDFVEALESNRRMASVSTQKIKSTTKMDTLNFINLKKIYK